MVAQLTTNEQVEVVRQAVLARGGKVTVGDIVGASGLDSETAKSCLNELIKTHEGTLQVSSTGELLYSFAPGVVLRDQRTWWERNKKTVMKVVKAIFKAIIFLVLVVYFVIYMVILIALLTQNKNGRSNIDLGWAFWFFWGRGYNDTSYYSQRNGSGRAREPVYTRVYNFVFGPEEPELNPLEASQQCAQLIRAKNGVITVEDWMMISGQSKEKCESDLARYTAEFNGNVDILDDGTLIYVFEDVVKSMKNKNDSLPVTAWHKLEKPKKLTANDGAGNGMVIGLNLFNLIMAFAIYFALTNYNEQQMMQPYPDLFSEQTIFWLATFPLVFSLLIFAGPLVRLPSHLKENRARRERSLHKALMGAIFKEDGTAVQRISKREAQEQMNRNLNRADIDLANPEEFMSTMNDVCNELGGELDVNSTEPIFIFPDMTNRLNHASRERKKLALDQQSLGHVVFSTNNDEQSDYEQAEAQDELDDFDRALQGEMSSGRNQSYSSGYGGYSGSNYSSGAGRNRSSSF